MSCRVRAAARRLAVLLAILVAACAYRQQSRDAHIPPFARAPWEPFSRSAAVAIALREWRAFGQPFDAPGVPETEDKEREQGLWQQIGEYWWLGLDRRWIEQRWTGIHDQYGHVFPASANGDYAWSAAFIDYVMRMAGADDHFPYAPNHATYIDAARRHTRGEAPNVWLDAYPLPSYAPLPGDLICAWRGRQPVTYADLPTPAPFPGHCDIVVGRQPGSLQVIGGNVQDAVTMKNVAVTPQGTLAGPDGSPVDDQMHWFVVLQVLYQDNTLPPPAVFSAPVASPSSRLRPPAASAAASPG
jgi:hypothetical protein